MADDADAWERHADWWQESFTNGADPEYEEQILPLAAVIERAAQSPRIQRRAEREVSLEAQVALLRHRVDQLELRLAALERPSPRGGTPGGGS